MVVWVAIAAAALGAGVFLALADIEIMQAGIRAFAFAAATFFPALVLGIFWKRANKWGATLGMIAGLGITFYYMVTTQVWMREALLGIPRSAPVQLWWDIQPISAGLWGVPLGFLVIIVVSGWILLPFPRQPTGWELIVWTIGFGVGFTSVGAVLVDRRPHEPVSRLTLVIGLLVVAAVGLRALAVALDARPGEGEGMASGDIVNTAARLQNAAPVNGILADEATYRGTRTVIDYRDAAAVDAKGKPEPIAVWEPVAPRARLGVDIAFRGGAALGGRTHELDARRGAFDRACRGRTPQPVAPGRTPGNPRRWEGCPPPALGRSKAEGQGRERDGHRQGTAKGRPSGFLELGPGGRAGDAGGYDEPQHTVAGLEQLEPVAA